MSEAEECFKNPLDSWVREKGFKYAKNWKDYCEQFPQETWKIIFAEEMDVLFLKAIQLARKDFLKEYGLEGQSFSKRKQFDAIQLTKSNASVRLETIKKIFEEIYSVEMRADSPYYTGGILIPERRVTRKNIKKGTFRIGDIRKIEKCFLDGEK